MPRPLLAALLLLSCGCAHAAALHLDDAQAERVGDRIFQNEAGRKPYFLVHWNKGEDFASLGIGHFIWHKAGGPASGPRFEESFPGLIPHLQAVVPAADYPAWLQPGIPAPWNSLEEFTREKDGTKANELRALLGRKDAIRVQARYAADRAEKSLPKVLCAVSAAEGAKLRARYDAVATTPQGVFALVDYVNFKGEGVERDAAGGCRVHPVESFPHKPGFDAVYDARPDALKPGEAEGWGLLQVLQRMDDAPAGPQAAAAFARAAEWKLGQRVWNTKPANGESPYAQYLAGWTKRVRDYVNP